MNPHCLNPTSIPVRSGRVFEKSSFVYFLQSVEVWEREPKVTIRPAACQVVPEVSLSFSRSSTFCPRSARWKAVEAPMIPPPMTTVSTDLGRGGRGEEEERKRAKEEEDEDRRRVEWKREEVIEVSE